MRPNPMLLLGARYPVIESTAELIAMALSSAAEGANPLAGTAAPVGYQPSVRYWRINAMAPVAAGDAIEVPESAT